MIDTDNKVIGKHIVTPKGGVLTVLERLCTSSNKHPKYISHCSLCSRDEALWPYGSIVSAGSTLLSGKVPCGCCYAPRYTENQHKIIITRLLEENNYTFISWAEPFKGYKTLVKYYNPAGNGDYSFSTINKIKCGELDPNTRFSRSSVSKTKNQKAVCLEFENKFNGILKVYPINNQNEFFDVECSVCKLLYENSVHKTNGRYVFRGVTKATLYKGVLPCYCNKSFVGSKRDLIFLLENKIENLGGTFLSLDWRGILKGSRVTWECVNGVPHDNVVYGFLKRRSGVCGCNTKSFDRMLPAYLYLVRWYCKDKTFLKFGITNIENLNTRLRRQKGASGLDYEIINLYRSDSGALCQDIETLIGRSLSKRFITKDIFPDGFSETIEDCFDNIFKVRNLCGSKLEEVF